MSLEVIEIGVGAVGFGIAIWQIVLARRQITRAADAAEAARDAVGRSESLMALLELVAAIPRMRRIERNLVISARAGNREAAEDQLHDWRTLVAETSGVLKAQEYDTLALETKLEHSSSSAAQAISLLQDQDVAAATKTVMTAIAAATDEAASLVGQLRAHPPVDGEGSR